MSWSLTISFCVNRFKGKGIVMTGGGLSYFTTTYVNLRTIRDKHKCTLPIEVFYAGEEEMSKTMIEFMHVKFANVRFIDIMKQPVLEGLDMKGYQIKAFAILLSSFKEVLFLDNDNHPISDPSVAFEFKGYKKTGAMFWHDKCIAHTAILEFWDVMGVPRPQQWPNDMQGLAAFTPTCNEHEPFELETGQIVLNKQRVWKALMMTAFINRHYKYFFDHLVNDDKNTFALGFNSTDTMYSVSQHYQFSVGRAGLMPDGSLQSCMSTHAQRNPDTGDILFLHRSTVKFDWGRLYTLQTKEPYRMWTHMSIQGPFSGYGLVFTGDSRVPQDVFIPGMRNTCLVPIGADLQLFPIGQEVWSIAR